MNRTELLRYGSDLERSGNLNGAETHYLTCLEFDPNWAEAKYRLGLVSLKKNNFEAAISCFDKARAMNFRVADTWNLTGIALAWQKHFEQAVPAFQNAIHSAPDFADPYVNLSNTLMELRRFEEAESCLVQLLLRHGRHVGALERLASLFMQREDMNKATQAYETILSIEPNNARACLAVGVLLAKRRQFQKALPYLERACQNAPESFEAFSNYGNCLREVGLLEPALNALQRAQSLNPEDATTHQNLGMLYGRLNQPTKAIEHFEASLHCMPMNAEAIVGIGAIQLSQGEYFQAKASFERAVQIDPDLALARFNLAQAQISCGDFENGFRNYEYRWQTSFFEPRHFSRPVWNGETNHNTRLLIYCEQGFGDSIQFIRYAQIAKGRVGKVYVEAPKRLIPLLSSCHGVDEWIPAGDDMPEFDFQIAMMSLPYVFRTRLESIPAPIPYLLADANRSKRWANLFKSHEKFFVGLAWQGNPSHQQDALRSIRLDQMLPWIIPEIQFVSLQKSESSIAKPSCEASFQFLELGSELDTDAAFVDTASIMSHLDLVISIDSAIAHLAGALGIPVFVPLIKAADWRWMMDRSDTPWYPSMTLFRQTQVGRWDDVIERIREELIRIIQTRPVSEQRS